jgi:hypothetical protein
VQKGISGPQRAEPQPYSLLVLHQFSAAGRVFPSTRNIINVLALTKIQSAAEGIRSGAACREKNVCQSTNRHDY